MNRNKQQKERAQPFIVTRTKHLNEAAEDYTELIADLICERGEARTCDIAHHMGISHVTALRTLQRLQGKGFVETSPHKPVVLTPKGKRLAAFCKRRHLLLLKFLKQIGVPECVAVVDVEGIEHHVSSQTLTALEKHLETL